MFLVISNNIDFVYLISPLTHTFHNSWATLSHLRIFQHKIFAENFRIIIFFYSFSTFIRRVEHRISLRRRRHNTTSLSIYIICFDQITLKYTFLLTFYDYICYCQEQEICLFECVLFSLQLFFVVVIVYSLRYIGILLIGKV